MKLKRSVVAIKTLIFNGSPRKNGDTAFLIQKLTDQLYGEIKIVNAYTANISPCTDCRKCREQFGCVIKYEMQEVYQYLEICDNVVIASPIYFSELTGKLLDLGSRLQLFFSAKQFLHETPQLKCKKGVVLLTGGGSGNPNKAYETAVCLMHYMNVQQIYPLICSHNTDHVPAKKDESILTEIERTAEFLNPSEEKLLFSAASVTMKNTPSEKIELFRSLFRGREDVYALRWQNQKSKKSGYSPVCQNKWIPGICHLPQMKCADCNYRSYAPVTDKVIYLHLSGKDLQCRDVVGIYPILPDETAYFLAIDFDEENWMDDVSEVRQVCKEYHIPVSVERSCSGNGAHLWIFFDTPILAKTARQLGSCLLTLAMQHRHEIRFDSYDRMFPNQDTMPSGGFGNLIALPLQKQALVQGNSVFVNEKFVSYSDQWAYLSTISKMQISETEQFIQIHKKDTDLGELFQEETSDKPWMLPISESS